jgi:hypothetical protein
MRRETDSMPVLAELFRDAIGGEPDLELETLGTQNAEEIASQLTAFATAHLAPVLDGLFYRRSVGLVVGFVSSTDTRSS